MTQRVSHWIDAVRKATDGLPGDIAEDVDNATSHVVVTYSLAYRETSIRTDSVCPLRYEVGGYVSEATRVAAEETRNEHTNRSRLSQGVV